MGISHGDHETVRSKTRFKMAPSLVSRLVNYVKPAVPVFKHYTALYVSFGITGFLIYKIPITDEMRKNSKFFAPRPLEKEEAYLMFKNCGIWCDVNVTLRFYVKHLLKMKILRYLFVSFALVS